MTSPMSSVVIVGGGPRGTGVLERIAASAPEFGVDLDVHLVDPYPMGAGRIWREDQSALLWMNSMAADVTMFTDDTVVCEGPIAPGPSLYEWAVAVRDGELDGERVPAGAVGDELRALGPATFASRRLQSHYLDWTLRHVIATLPAGVRLHRHATRAVGTSEDGGAAEPAHRVLLEDGTTLVADVLVLASGHLDASPTDAEAGLAAYAAEHGLAYFPPEQTTDTDLDAIPPGETVIAQGMGLAFVDLMVLLFEGRGGLFVEVADGRLEYVPSGREPTLYVGSGRGVPYHAKTAYSLRGPRPPLPRFLGPEEIGALRERGEIDLRRDVWPLMAKEVGWGHYHELFHGHPDRVDGDWDTFAARYAELDWYSEAMRSLVAAAVPDEADRLDFERVDRPLAGVAADLETLQKQVRNYIEDDLVRHVDPRHTAELGAFVALLSVYAQVAELAGSPALTPRSRALDLAWWQNLFSSLASGPPGPRLRQLLALARGGWVSFLGAGLRVEAVDGEFRASAESLAGGTVSAPTFVEARLSAPSVARTLDPMLASLHAAGQVQEEILREDVAAAVHSADAAAAHADDAADDAAPVVLHHTGLVRVRASDFRIVDDEGRADPTRFAIGPHTNVRLPGAFTRPRTNALSFRANDAVARAVLGAAGGPTNA